MLPVLALGPHMPHLTAQMPEHVRCTHRIASGQVEQVELALLERQGRLEAQLKACGLCISVWQCVPLPLSPNSKLGFNILASSHAVRIGVCTRGGLQASMAHDFYQRSGASVT